MFSDLRPVPWTKGNYGLKTGVPTAEDAGRLLDQYFSWPRHSAAYDRAAQHGVCSEIISTLHRYRILWLIANSKEQMGVSQVRHILCSQVRGPSRPRLGGCRRFRRLEKAGYLASRIEGRGHTRIYTITALGRTWLNRTEETIKGLQHVVDTLHRQGRKTDR